jgi:formylglycine-generating enzyme required for sulfatase activity
MKRRHLVLLTLILAAVFSAFLLAERGMTESRSVILKFKGEDGRVREDKLYSGSFALLIGAGKYRAGLQDLPGVKRDIEDMENALKEQGFTIVTVIDPDREHLLGAIDDFINKYGRDAGNRLLIYFAGHGCTLKLKYGGDMGFIAPVDAPDPRLNEAGFKAKAVDMQKFESFAKTIDSKHVLFVFDSCFSGSVFEIVNRDVPEAISYKTERPVRQFMTAGSADEEVSDKSDFKREFIEGIKGEADSDHDGYVTATELGVYLNSKVAKYSKGCQHPQFGTIRDPVLDKGDFVFDYGKLKTPDVPSPAYEPNLPPKASLDMSGLENEAQKNREAKEKEHLAWVEWQGNLSRDFEKLKGMEANPDISFPSKKQAWEKFLETYGKDNPYSKEDENFRQYAEGRIAALDQKVAEEAREATSQPKQVAMGTMPSVITNAKDGSELIMIPAGEFLMGSNDYDNEKPPHRIYLNAYYIGKYEVTNEQFAKFVNETGYNAGGEWKGWYKSGTEDHPVVCVSWNDAKAYCDWANLRLPTEAEWEKAARGADGRKYPWGDELDVSRFNFNSDGTKPVGSYPNGASPYGCMDMAGNVSEWCSDRYGEKYYSKSPSSDPQGPSSGSSHVLRGGSWDNKADYFQCAGRVGVEPVIKACGYGVGFRVARSLNRRSDIMR